MGRWNGTTTDRGYGAKHVAIRKQRIANHRPGDPCAMGGEPLWQPVEELDVPHDHVNGGYLPGLACRAHNRAEGAIRNNAMRGFTLASAGPKGPYVICKDCGQNYTRAARVCMVCGAHYHPSYAEQRTCGRACGVEMRRQLRGHAGSRTPQPRPPCQSCGQPCATLSETICQPCRTEARQAARDAKPGPSSKVAYYTCRYCGKPGVTRPMGQLREVCPDRTCQLGRLYANNLRQRHGFTQEQADKQVAAMVTGSLPMEFGQGSQRFQPVLNAARRAHERPLPLVRPVDRADWHKCPTCGELTGNQRWCDACRCISVNNKGYRCGGAARVDGRCEHHADSEWSRARDW